MNIIIRWLLSGLIILAAAYLLPGVHIQNFVAALVVALILGIINTFLKPLLILLTLPINILSFGLFTLVINAVLIMFTSSLVQGFTVDSFWWALFFGLLLSILNSLIHKVL